VVSFSIVPLAEDWKAMLRLETRSLSVSTHGVMGWA